MQTVTWLIERNVFDRDAQFLAALEKQNCPYKEVRYLDFRSSYASDYFPDHDCVLLRGTLGLSRNILRTFWISGAYMDEKDLRCSTAVISADSTRFIQPET